ncbi:MAG: hypothetical protein H0U10_09930 [Chloroflexia bacterium]|nr:hypothetical protein [Chloroflexia bacterium]
MDSTADTNLTACDDAIPNDCTLRGAINLANANAGADTINFASGISTITLTATGTGDNNNTAGDLDITDDLTINGGSSGVIIEDGAGWSERVIDIIGAPTASSSTDVTITDATIRNGNAIFGVGNQNASFGGGIRVNGFATLGDVASLTLRRSTVTGNHADQLGGGIYDEFESDITLEDSTVSNNTSGGSGGIHVRGSLTMVNSTISGNEGDGLGGGISAGGGTTVTMTDSTMSGNTAKNEDGGSDAGGGIYMSGATVTLTDTTVSGNTAEGCALCRGLGGGIYVDSGTLDLANTTVSGNTAQSGDSLDADGEGGGIYTLGGAVTLSNGTVAFNTAGAAGTGGAGGGVFVSNQSTGSLTFRNSILARNNADLQSEDLAGAGTFSSQGYNLLGASPGSILAPTDIVDPNPLLGPLANNGGSTQTHALQTGSPAIDAANPAAPGSGGTACETTDQRGTIRPQDGDGDASATCDIGAFEKAAGGGGGDPTMTINDVSVREGNGGFKNAVFTVTLDASSGQQVTTDYATTNGSAKAPADYTATGGTLTFTPGQTTKTISVAVRGDRRDERNEAFFVNLSNATNASISDGQGRATIRDNDR